MEKGELRKKLADVSLDVIPGLRWAIEQRKSHKYGTPEQRREAYAALHNTTQELFDRFSTKVGTVGHDDRRRIIFALPDIGMAILDETVPGGEYQLLIRGEESTTQHGHLKAYTKRLTNLVINPDQVTISDGYHTEYMSDDFNPHSGGGYWNTSSNLSRPKPLDVTTASDLALELSVLPPEAAMMSRLLARYPEAE